MLSSLCARVCPLCACVATGVCVQVAGTMKVFEAMFSWIRGEDNVILTIDDVLERAQDAVYRYGIRGLVIDPYNEMEHNRPNGRSETEYISQLLSKVPPLQAAALLVSVTRSTTCFREAYNTLG